jgi:hypothetical protein
MAFLFETSQGRVHEWMHTLSIVLKMARGEAHVLPERDPKNLEQTLTLCVSVDCIIVSDHGVNSFKINGLIS